METRTRILEAAVRLLEQQGGHGVRMGDIAKAAGISRQAVYLHFASRAQLLEATTRYVDDRLDLEKRLTPSREAVTGIERLEAYIEFWGDYIPKIYSVAKPILMTRETDEAAETAWRERMLAMREGCHAAVKALESDGVLADQWNVKTATDCLWTMLSVTNWEQLTKECGWSNRQYVRRMKSLARRAFVARPQD